jgi:hypothetical protein
VTTNPDFLIGHGFPTEQELSPQTQHDVDREEDPVPDGQRPATPRPARGGAIKPRTDLTSESTVSS